MTVATGRYPEAYEDFEEGDEVFCLAWIGMPFRVVGKDDHSRQIFIDGQGPCSLPEGARVDILPSTMFMLTHNQWDHVWYWPDRAGETYKEVVDRFVGDHREGEIVTGYPGGYKYGLFVDPYLAQSTPDEAMSFRLSFGALDAWHVIYAHPVAAVSADQRELVREYDPAIPDDKWLAAGPALPLQIAMHGYRWALMYGSIPLNVVDFARVD